MIGIIRTVIINDKETSQSIGEQQVKNYTTCHYKEYERCYPHICINCISCKERGYKPDNEYLYCEIKQEMIECDFNCEQFKLDYLKKGI